jgi:pimeloyl-ACP methyl ester carboxylesterase
MKLFKLFSGFIFVILTVTAVTIAQIPFYTFPVDDGTKSYYVTGENGVNIFVEEKGDPKNPTIIFSSGYLTSRISWDPQWLDPEIYEKFHLIRYDYRGMGSSDKPNKELHSPDLNTDLFTRYMSNIDNSNSYSLDLYAADLFALISKLSSEYDFKEKKIVLVGWSIGVPVSLNFMKNYPDITIHGLVSVSGLVNNTREMDDKLAPLFQDMIDPQDNFFKVVSGLDRIFSLMSYKTFSDELKLLFLGSAAMAPLEYRLSAIGKYKKSLLFFFSIFRLIYLLFFFF